MFFFDLSFYFFFVCFFDFLNFFFFFEFMKLGFSYYYKQMKEVENCFSYSSLIVVLKSKSKKGKNIVFESQ